MENNLFNKVIAVRMLQEQSRLEIEKAIDNIKRTPFDKWFRREFYRLQAKRRWRNK